MTIVDSWGAFESLASNETKVSFEVFFVAMSLASDTQAFVMCFAVGTPTSLEMISSLPVTLPEIALDSDRAVLSNSAEAQGYEGK